LIGNHTRSRKNIIEYEIDGSVENEGWIRIKLIAIEIRRMMSDGLGSRAERVGKDQEMDEGILRGSWVRAKKN
jgi:hypothetical protein